MGFSYQLYSSRNFPPLSDTLAMLGRLGYDQVEGFGGLFAGLSDLAPVKEQLDAAGLRMTTGHFGMDMIEERPQRVLEIARALGIEAVFVPAVPPGYHKMDAAGWDAFGKRLADAGKPFLDAGLTFGWHNHDFEFAEIDSTDKPLDLILSRSDDVKLELDLAWAFRAGEDPAKWIDRYADRLVAAHVKDVAPEGTCLDEDGWADLGQGVMDWPALMTKLRGTGARYFVMEHDNPSDDARFAERSLAAAKAL